METPINFKYLMATGQDNAWGMVATTAGMQDIPPGMSYPAGNHPHRYSFSSENGRILPEYQLVYITRGRGWFRSSHQKKVEISAGDMFLLFSGEWHNYAPYRDSGWYESWIGFTGENMDRLLSAGFFSPEHPVFHIGIHDDILNLFRTAIRTVTEQKAGYQQVLAGTVAMLLGQVYAADRQGAFRNSGMADKINAAKAFMQENITKNISAEDVASSIDMGYSLFRRLFKEHTGFAPAQYMQELKIIKSKELLTNTAMTCQEIAWTLGFESPSYFNIAFRKKTGMTPSRYREISQGRNWPVREIAPPYREPR